MSAFEYFILFHVTGQLRLGKLQLVDLAGTDRVVLSGAQGESLAEGNMISVSITALGGCRLSLMYNLLGLVMRALELLMLMFCVYQANV